MTYEERIHQIIKAEEISNKIDALDNKTVKTLALEIMNAYAPDRKFRRSDLTMKDSRCILFQECMLNGYEF